MEKKLTTDQLNAIWVDPDLVLTTLEDIAEASTRGKDDGDLLAACAAAYVDYAGIDAPPGVDALDEADILTIIALVSRVHALSSLLASGSIAPDAFDPESIAAAAASARLTDADDPPVFQLLDFLACANRAAAEARS
jgi:hypothetical protein